MTCLRPLPCRIMGLLMVLVMAAGAGASNEIGRAPTDPPQEKQKPNEVAKEKEKKDQPKKKVQGLPLEPDRTIEFTTDEGTWLSLDISPDGKTIVFELLGDLYTLPIAGGEVDHDRVGVRQSAELFARRQDDRVRERSRR